MTDGVGRPDRRAALQQFVRYGVVGAAINLSGYVLYLVVTSLGMTPKAAMTMLYVGGATMAYIGNRKWTFGYRGDTLQSGARFLLAHLSGYLLNFLLLLICVDALGLPHQAVQGAAVFIVGLYLFLIFKFLVFRAARPGADP